VTLPPALTLLPPTPALELAAIHRLAVCYGANDTRARGEAERQSTPTKLLTLAAARGPDLALSTFVVQTLGSGRADARLEHIISQLKLQAAGSIRLCQRALEVHGRNVGYDLDEWSAKSVETTSALLQLSHTAETRGDDGPTPLGELREANRAICCALAACENDRMAVPEHLSEAIGRLLLLFMLASELRSTGRRSR
jgi:hypothetical protein